MELLNVIRLMSLRLKLPIRDVAPRSGLSRNTVKKHLKAGAVESKFAIPDRPSKLDPFAEELAGWLKSERDKSRKQRRTLKQLHLQLLALGFTGSYSRVAAFARDWRADRQREQQTTGRGTLIPLAFRLGEALQIGKVIQDRSLWAVSGLTSAPRRLSSFKLGHAGGRWAVALASKRVGICWGELASKASRWKRIACPDRAR